MKVYSDEDGSQATIVLDGLRFNHHHIDKPTQLSQTLLHGLSNLEPHHHIAP